MYSFYGMFRIFRICLQLTIPRAIGLPAVNHNLFIVNIAIKFDKADVVKMANNR
jgi:hypothetical protein